jgi:DnaJ-class molecular chaperone
MFQDISEAFSVLSDEDKRRTYDQFGERGLQEGGGGGGGNPFAGFGQGANFQFRGDPADLFKQFFNGGGFGSGGFQSSGGGVRFGFGRDSRPKRRHRIQHHLNCTLEELYCGCRKSIRVVNGHPNYTNEFRNFEIVVQPGWKDGTRAVFERVANSPDPGVDVVFVVTQLKHPVYTRKGGDLHTTVTISLQQALVGINDFLPALDGRRIPLNTTGAGATCGGPLVPPLSKFTSAHVKISLPQVWMC